MKTIGNLEVLEWCKHRGIINGPDRQMELASKPCEVVEVAIPERALDIIALALAITNSSVPVHTDFLFYMRDWGFWSEAFEQSGLRIIENIRAGLESKEPLLETPGHLLSSSEIIDITGLLIQPMLFQWDAYLIPTDAIYLIEISHECRIRIYCASSDTARHFCDELSNWGAASLVSSG